MAFSESIKITVRRQSHHSCCICKGIGIEVHHIIPEGNGGPDTFENAAPLCPSCHETYGANPTKRKMIVEARDLWYEICAARYKSDGDRIEELLRNIASLKAELVCPAVAEAVAGAVVERLINEGVIKRSNHRGWSLAQILGSLAISEHNLPIPNIESVDTTYTLIFKTKGGNSEQESEFNDTRDNFLAIFGSFIARQYCAYLVHRFKINWKSGVTDSELEHMVGPALVGMVLLLNHEDIVKGDDGLRVWFNEEGALTASAKRTGRPTEPSPTKDQG